MYNNFEEKHIVHVNKILLKLKKINLYLNINECEFYVIMIKYSHLIIIIEDI